MTRALAVTFAPLRPSQLGVFPALADPVDRQARSLLEPNWGSPQRRIGAELGEGIATDF